MPENGAHRPEEADQQPAGPPAGFSAHVPGSAFVRLLGPLFSRQEEDGTTSLGLFIRDEHLNANGVAHGGLLATLADSLLGWTAARAAGAPIATVSLNIGYLGRVRKSEWLELQCRVEKLGHRLAFASCIGHAGAGVVLKADGIFSIDRSTAR